MVTAAFAAVEGLARGLALDLAPIRVNALRPGLVDSEMWSFLDEPARDGLRAAAAAQLPVGRIGTVDDVSLLDDER